MALAYISSAFIRLLRQMEATKLCSRSWPLSQALIRLWAFLSTHNQVWIWIYEKFPHWSAYNTSQYVVQESMPLFLRVCASPSICACLCDGTEWKNCRWRSDNTVSRNGIKPSVTHNRFWPTYIKCSALVHHWAPLRNSSCFWVEVAFIIFLCFSFLWPRFSVRNQSMPFSVSDSKRHMVLERTSGWLLWRGRIRSCQQKGHQPKHTVRCHVETETLIHVYRRILFSLSHLLHHNQAGLSRLYRAIKKEEKKRYESLNRNQTMLWKETEGR